MSYGEDEESTSIKRNRETLMQLYVRNKFIFIFVSLEDLPEGDFVNIKKFQ